MGRFKRAIVPVFHLLGCCSLVVLLATASPAEEPEQSAAEGPTAAQAVQAPAELPRITAGEYRVQPGDRISSSVWGEPNLSSDATVMTHGAVSFPLVGEIAVSQKTVSELTEELRQAYLLYYRDPKVSLSVIPAVWPKVYVQGNVRRPGPVDYSPERRLLDYVGLAGGFSAGADLSQLTVVSHQSAAATAATFDLSPEAAGEAGAPNPTLSPGDTVFVGTAMPVSVIGAVNKPGALTYQHGLRLSDYVGLAGGPTNRAKVREVVLKRAGPDGDGAVRKVDLAAALGDPDDPKLNPVLEPGVVVTVPEQFLGGTLEWSDVLRALAAVFIWK